MGCTKEQLPNTRLAGDLFLTEHFKSHANGEMPWVCYGLNVPWHDCRGD